MRREADELLEILELGDVRNEMATSLPYGKQRRVEMARALATKRMCEVAEAMGADAVICIRYSSASIMQGAAEVMAYGTAIAFTG